MLTSNLVIWSPLLTFLVPFSPPPTEAGCNWLELPLVVREQFFGRLVGYVFRRIFLEEIHAAAAPLLNLLVSSC